MPRNLEGDALAWEETWPYLLQDRVPGSEVINCGARARASGGLLGQELIELRAKGPDLVIVQVGIVDCSPRIFTALEKRILALPVVPARLRDYVIARRAARRAEITRRAPLARVHTPPGAFADHLDQFARATAPTRMIFLPVLAHPARMEAKSPGHGGNVRLYNDLLRAAAARHRAGFVEPSAILGAIDVDAAFMNDAYHLSARGSLAVADALVPVVAAVLRS